jgi:molybdate transport repressor ModE-like protein
MRIVPTIGWAFDGEGGEPVDARLIPLLEAIAATSSLAAAVVACEISYRAGWGLLRDYERKLGKPLVRLERGRGASLVELGESLLRAQTTARERLARVMADVALDVGTTARPVERPAAPSLHAAASHDVALTALLETLPESAGVRLEVSVMGSLNALKEFAEGRTDAAGFHVPIGDHAAWDRSSFLQCLHARRDKLIRFVDREQGLILPHGNPARVRNLRGVVDRGLKFINRQRGSATRLLIDRMLAEESIDLSRLQGFEKEEFTHPAVAATVASGAADAGFGLRAAAAEHGLTFVPLVRERYYFAIRAKNSGKASHARFVEALRSSAFAKLVRRLAGYDATGAGSVSGIEVLRRGEAGSRRR